MLDPGPQILAILTQYLTLFRFPIPHAGTVAAQQCCDGELRPNGSC